MSLLEKPAPLAAGKHWQPRCRPSCVGPAAPAWLGPSHCPWTGSQHPGASAAPPAEGCVVSAEEPAPRWSSLRWPLEFHLPAREGVMLLLPWASCRPAAAAAAPRWNLVWWWHPAGHDRGSSFKHFSQWRLTYKIYFCFAGNWSVHQRKNIIHSFIHSF